MISIDWPLRGVPCPRTCRPFSTMSMGRWLLPVAVLAAITGCQRSPYELAPVHGTITIDGQPFTHGKVMFAPVARADNLNPGKPAFGQLQDNGSFVLSTYDTGDGAVVGEHSVTIINIDPPAADGTLTKTAQAPQNRCPNSNAHRPASSQSSPDRTTNSTSSSRVRMSAALPRDSEPRP